MSKRSTEEKLALLKKMGMEIATKKELEVLPTKVRELNELLPGGLPKGKVTLAYGPNASHKTSVMVEAIGLEQQRDAEHLCLFIPSERGEDLSYYETHLGLVLEQTIIMPPDDKGFYMMEHSLQKACEIMQEGLVSSVIIDSWDAFVANKEIYTTDGAEKDVTKETVGAKAAVSSKMWRKMKSLIADNHVMFGVICQVRTKGLGSYVVTEGFSGGTALEHNSDLVIYQKSIKQVKSKVEGRDVTTGHIIRFELKKIRVGGKSKNLYKQVEVNYQFGESWDTISGLFDIAVGKGIIIKGGGGWYTYPGFPLNKQNLPKVRGEDTAKKYFSENENNLEFLGKLIDEFNEQEIDPSDNDEQMLEITQNLYDELLSQFTENTQDEPKEKES